jgi:hypothetical protein
MLISKKNQQEKSACRNPSLMAEISGTVTQPFRADESGLKP